MRGTEVGLSFGFVGLGIEFVDWRRYLFMKNRRNSGPAGFSRLSQWGSASADNIETTEPISEFCINKRANLRGLRELTPGLPGLTLYPSSQVLLSSRCVVWDQSVQSSNRLNDERAKPNGSDHKGPAPSSGCSSIHEGKLSWRKDCSVDICDRSLVYSLET